MTYVRFKYSYLTAAMLLSGLSTAVEAKDCTAQQKQLANDQLIAISTDTQRQAAISSQHAPFGLPTTVGDIINEEVLYQEGYILGYDGDLRTTLWVSYKLTAQDISNANRQQRVNCFRTDPRLQKDLAAKTSDYREPIYDQGHMANDADLKDNLVEQLNTYVMSNMSPQHCRFNRGIWLSLEHLGRIWAQKYEEIYIISGAIFDRDGQPGRDEDTVALRMKSNNGKERVAVPSGYFKTFLRQEAGVWRSITFNLPHNDEDKGVTWDEVRPTLEADISPINDLEVTASIDLFPNLDPASLQESLDGSGWDMSEGRSNFSSSCR